MLRPCRRICLRQDHTIPLQSCARGDLLKAQLDTTPSRRRARVTLPEGLSRWFGGLMPVALSVVEPCNDSLLALVGDSAWCGKSPLVHFDIVFRGRHQVRLPALGDFPSLPRSWA
jgi:hypothetical protein